MCKTFEFGYQKGGDRKKEEEIFKNDWLFKKEIRVLFKESFSDFLVYAKASFWPSGDQILLLRKEE